MKDLQRDQDFPRPGVRRMLTVRRRVSHRNPLETDGLHVASWVGYGRSCQDSQRRGSPEPKPEDLIYDKDHVHGRAGRRGGGQDHRRLSPSSTRSSTSRSISRARFAASPARAGRDENHRDDRHALCEIKGEIVIVDLKTGRQPYAAYGCRRLHVRLGGREVLRRGESALGQSCAGTPSTESLTSSEAAEGEETGLGSRPRLGLLHVPQGRDRARIRRGRTSRGTSSDFEHDVYRAVVAGCSIRVRQGAVTRTSLPAHSRACTARGARSITAP